MGEEMKDIEEDLRMRKELLERKCQQLEQYLPKPKKDVSHLRMYPEHNLAWCENYKVGSSTWASHLLTLARVPIHQHTPIHRLAARHFSPIKEPSARERFLLSATTFLVVRHPFERLLSAFMDKLSKPITRKTHRPTAEHPHWSFFPFGNIQEAIRAKYRRGASNKSAPTFAEFLAYLVGEAGQAPWNPSTVTGLVNNAHWRPITTNCDPCRQRYSLVMHLDTLARDSTFLKQKLGLNIDTGFVRREGAGGRTGHNRTVEAFKLVDPLLVSKLYQLYRLDFELFGFTAEDYL